MKKIIISCCIVGLIFASCKEDKSVNIEKMISEWNGKVINFPSKYLSYLNGNFYYDSINISDFKIISYVDSIGCTSCKLKLNLWKSLIADFDSINTKVSFSFFIHPRDVHELKRLLKREKFEYPVCIDEGDELNKLNRFPPDIDFHTFLINKNNEIVAIGNPINNIEVKNLYLKIIRGEKIEKKNESETMKTKVFVEASSVSLNTFDWQKEQNVTFTLKNIGNHLLVMQNINTSCGCTTVSYSKEPVQPGKELKLDVIYKADHPEHFSKTITVYCNTESSPIRLTISGNAE